MNAMTIDNVDDGEDIIISNDANVVNDVIVERINERKKKTIQIGLIISQEQNKKLEALARAGMRSKSNMIRFMIDEYYNMLRKKSERGERKEKGEIKN